MIKKFIKYSILTLFFCGGMTFTSCSDEDVNSKNNLPDLEEWAEDLTDNEFVIFHNLKSEGEEVSFKLGTLKDVELTLTPEVAGDDPYNFRVETRSDGYQYVVSDKVDNNTEFKSSYYDLNVKVKGSDLEKSVLIVPRLELKYDPMAYVRKSLGRGVNLFNDLGATGDSVIDLKRISIDENTNVQGGYSWETGGKRISETSEKYSVKVGVKGNFPTNKVLFAPAFTTTTNEETTFKNSYEYYMYFIVQHASDVVLDESIYTSLSKRIACLDAAANDILNVPRSDLYKQYSLLNKAYKSEQEVAYAIFDRFGTHVLTRAKYGAVYRSVFMREENAYKHSIGEDVSADLQFTWGKDEANQTQQATNSKYMIQNQDDISWYSSDYQEASKTSKVITVDGNKAIMQMSKWLDEGLNKKKTWVPISYEVGKYEFSTDDNNLIELKEFSKIPARRKLLEDWIDQYIQDRAPDVMEDELVLADVIMIPGKVGGHKTSSDPEEFKILDSNFAGRKLIYYPLYQNPNGPYDDQIGYPLDTDQDKYVDLDGDRPHYWWYALGHKSQVSGFSDIRLGRGNDDLDAKHGWTIRGNEDDNSAQTGINSDIQNNCVYLRSPVDDEQLVTAIGLARNLEEKDSDRDQWGEVIFASSAGAQWMVGTQGYNANRQAFIDYWDANGVFDDPNNTGFYEGFMVSTPYDVHMVKSYGPWMNSINGKAILSWGDEDSNGDPSTKNPVQFAIPWPDSTK